MKEPVSASRVRIAIAKLLFREEIDVGELYRALGIDPADADSDVLAHLAGILDGMEAASKGIRDEGLEGWSRKK
ncbi:hypothetical protein [Parvularcula maris]|uniref:Uncharacterized protein n=1 Tax=Parvularcula maris TaxID=2965077 RepID=A0A9X2LBA1_9PROT|nr:hypothetical protein [Parvularcula maris]MCQ8186563.1 hypothetical protein [Parvularcula maris]